MMQKMRKEEYFRKRSINPESRIKQEKQESSKKKESKKKKKKQGKPKQRKVRKVCPLMGDLFSQLTKPSNFLNGSTLIL